MRRRRNTKIIATLGPASATPERIEALFDAGADVFRLNLSHGTHAEHREVIDTIRALERARNRPIAVMTDLQGPKLRIGELADGVAALEKGARTHLELSRKIGDASQIPLPHAEVFAALDTGTEVLIDDGRVRLRVLEHGSDSAEAEVIVGGRISDHKGVNLPGRVLGLSALTPKDQRDLQFALDVGADWVALSFVQRPEDVAEVRKLVRREAAIIVKLEKPAAIDSLDEIIDLADALMIARGDLGVEMPPEDVPSVQKRIVWACRNVGKPVVVATQMLESMVASPAPTRAEASDVATAVYEGADAVMLSAETAVGSYPTEAVAMMNRIVARVERDPIYRSMMDAEQLEPEATSADAISAAATQIARTLSAVAILAYTTSGSTALRAARQRPEVAILGLTPDIVVARRLALVWGVHAIHTADVRDFRSMVDKACRMARRDGFAEPGQRLVITAGYPFGTPGATNVLRIETVGP